MNLQQSAYPRSSANGFSKHKAEPSSKLENKLQQGKSNPIGVIGSGITSISRGVSSESLPRDRLVYLTTCLIGLHVEVQVKSGSIYSGIFHATNADTDFGIVLKMARLTKDVSLRGKNTGTSVSKAPTKTLIIPAHELVQVVAKDVAVTRDGLSNELQGESQPDIMLDSYISQSHHVDIGRELKPWMPDEDAPQCPELDNIFDSPWTGRSWDQFKANEALFGVQSTFNEDLYTIKLEKGPQTRELEEEARRIAREIEGEVTYDLHLAEERGAYPHAGFDLDEETKYSSVFRGFDDSGCADEDVVLDSHNTETFGDLPIPGFIRSFADVTSGKTGKGLLDGGRVSSGLLSKDESHTVKFSASQEIYHSISPLSDSCENAICGFKDDGRAQEKHIDLQGVKSSVEETYREGSQTRTANSDDLQSSSAFKRDGSEKGGVSSMMASSSTVCVKIEEKTSPGDLSNDKSTKLHLAELKTSHGLPGSSGSPSTSEIGGATLAKTCAALSPTSSVGSLSSEKSLLNPNAKEFRPNPNAKSFVPSQRLLRPVSPVNDASFYFQPTASTVPHMHGMPVGMGVGPSFAGHQPVFYNPQAAGMQPQQAYHPANGPQYGHQMIIGHPGQQVMYMTGYPTGREF
ncbi:hypothetical protein vseg_013008 [Gypsophila vaccaria]